MKQTVKNKKKLEKQGVSKVRAEDQDTINIKSVDVLWGIDTSKYRQKNLKDYQDFLNQCSNVELENHAHEMGVSISLDKEDIFAQLIRLFNFDVAARNKPKNTNISIITPEMNKKLIAIMNS